jgi:NAD(P)H-flavin reductase
MTRAHKQTCVQTYPSGNISKLFGELKIGDSMAVRGPKGNFNYSANISRAIGMIAGGTGITPMLQVSRDNIYRKKCLISRNLDRLLGPSYETLKTRPR